MAVVAVFKVFILLVNPFQYGMFASTSIVYYYYYYYCYYLCIILLVRTYAIYASAIRLKKKREITPEKLKNTHALFKIYYYKFLSLSSCHGYTCL